MHKSRANSPSKPLPLGLSSLSESKLELQRQKVRRRLIRWEKAVEKDCHFADLMLWGVDFRNTYEDAPDIDFLTDFEDIFDDFDILTEIDSGNSGYVVFAVNKECGTHVALKFQSSVAYEVAQQQLEMELLSQWAVSGEIGSRYVARLYSVFVASKILISALEYVDGIPLYELASLPFSEATLYDIYRQIETGIQHIYRAGYVHRDLKLDNMIISKEGEVKIIDFGSAWPLGEKMPLKILAVGTAGYTAPEIVYAIRKPSENARFDPVIAERWALGVTLYCLANGYNPFPGENNAELFENVSKNRMRPMKAGISEPLKNFILDLLSYYPSIRRATLGVRWQGPPPGTGGEVETVELVARAKDKTFGGRRVKPRKLSQRHSFQ